MCCHCAIVGLSFSSQKTVQLRDYVSDANCNENLVFVVSFLKPLCALFRRGLFCYFTSYLCCLTVQFVTMVHAKIDVDYIDLISGYS